MHVSFFRAYIYVSRWYGNIRVPYEPPDGGFDIRGGNDVFEEIVITDDSRTMLFEPSGAKTSPRLNSQLFGGPFGDPKKFTKRGRGGRSIDPKQSGSH